MLFMFLKKYHKNDTKGDICTSFPKEFYLVLKLVTIADEYE